MLRAAVNRFSFLLPPPPAFTMLATQQRIPEICSREQLISLLWPVPLPAILTHEKETALSFFVSVGEDNTWTHKQNNY
jgi:hypothetical protein